MIFRRRKSSLTHSICIHEINLVLLLKKIIKMENERTELAQNHKLHKHSVLRSYLILDKANKVVAEKSTLEDAEMYVKSRPYLKYEKFEMLNESVACDLDDIL